MSTRKESKWDWSLIKPVIYWSAHLEMNRTAECTSGMHLHCLIWLRLTWLTANCPQFDHYYFYTLLHCFLSGWLCNLKHSASVSWAKGFFSLVFCTRSSPFSTNSAPIWFSFFSYSICFLLLRSFGVGIAEPCRASAWIFWVAAKKKQNMHLLVGMHQQSVIRPIN